MPEAMIAQIKTTGGMARPKVVPLIEEIAANQSGTWLNTVPEYCEPQVVKICAAPTTEKPMPRLRINA